MFTKIQTPQPLFNPTLYFFFLFFKLTGFGIFSFIITIDIFYSTCTAPGSTDAFGKSTVRAIAVNSNNNSR